MSYSIPTSNNAPVIERILSDPINFVKARNPDIVKIKPSSYKTFSASSKKDKTFKSEAEEPDSKMASVERALRPKPKSMAEAVAAYTGKKFATKIEKKLEKRESKRLRKAAQLKSDREAVLKNVVITNNQEHLTLNSGDEQEQEQDQEQKPQDIQEESEAEPELKSEISSEVETTPAVEDEDGAEVDASSDDNDYQTADENEDEAGSSSSESDSNEVEEDENASDLENEEDGTLGRIKINDSEKEELEEGDVTTNPIKSISPSPDDKDVENTDQNTPPTSPEDDASGKLSPQHSYLSDDEFFQIDEEYNDRGSNGSQRIYKNWRELKKYKQPLGLVNQGVTCYMNAAIQALVHTPAVQHYLTDVHNNKYSNTISNSSVTKTFADTSAKMWQLDNDGNKKVSMINPRKLIRRLDDINCMMSEWQQEDSHEYFMSLMSRLQEDSTPKGHKLNESIMYDIFGGLLHQSVSCNNCGHISKTEQEFYDLSLNLDNRRKKNANEEGEEELNSKRYSIKKSLYDFFSPELIKTDKRDKSGYVCEKCKQRTNASKHNEIKRAPETLPVHLKRFRFNGTSSSKLKTGVSFPSTLDLTNFTVDNEPTRYKLISVVAHEGRSVSSGHYIAQCRQPDGSWCVYDDEYINKVSEKEVLKNTSAYFLIYTRITHKSKKQDWQSSVSGEKRKNGNTKGNSPNKRSKR